MLQLHILIVGGGIAGLAAARALKKCGHRVEIFERSSFSNEVGAAITISPNGSRVLRELGFDFSKAGGVRMQRLQFYDATTLSKRGDVDFGPDIETKCGAPWQAMHRGDLHQALWDLALQDRGEGIPVKLHTGMTVTQVDAENARLELADGRTFEGDLLIGADGLRSQVRAACLGKKSQPLDTGFQIYRFLVPTEVILDDPETKDIFDLKGENSRAIFDLGDAGAGEKLRFVWYDCRNATIQNFAAFYRGERDEMKEEDFGHPADKDKLLELYSKAHSKIKRVLQKAGGITYWRMYERLPLGTLVHGRTLLIGDAGHPMTPLTAAGAVQAIEDAGALLGLFLNIPSKESVADRLNMFEEVRLIRVSRIQTGSSFPNKDGSPNPLAEANKSLVERDEIPEHLKSQDTHSSDRILYDYSYDVFEHCKKVLGAGK